MLHDPTQTVPKCADPPSSVYTEGAISRPTEESNVTAGGAARGSAVSAAAADDRELTSAVQPSSDAEEEGNGLVPQNLYGTCTRNVYTATLSCTYTYT